MSKTGGRTLAAVISKILVFGDIIGFFSCLDGVQNRPLIYSAGLHRFIPLLTLKGEIGWLPNSQ